MNENPCKQLEIWNRIVCIVDIVLLIIFMGFCSLAVLVPVIHFPNGASTFEKFVGGVMYILLIYLSGCITGVVVFISQVIINIFIVINIDKGYKIRTYWWNVVVYILSVISIILCLCMFSLLV